MSRISERLENIEEYFEDIAKQKKAPKRTFFDKVTGKKKTKQFKLPTKITKGSKKKIKKNYALVIYIRNNGYLEFNYAPIVNDLIYMKQSGLYHSATADYMLQHMSRGKSYPVLIQPEWALTPIKKGDTVTYQQSPFSAKYHAEDTITKGDQAAKQKILIEIVKQSQITGQKGKIPGKTMLWIIVAIIIVLYLLNSFLGS